MSNSMIETIVSSLNSGGTVLYPTDTIWGLGCDATNATAVAQLYTIKQRDLSKSMLVLCPDMEMVQTYFGDVDVRVLELLLNSDRPTTVILPVRNSLLADNLLASDKTVGVRIPRMEFCQKLLKAFGRPLVSTSANLSGKPSPHSFADIDLQLVQSVDFCVPPDYEQQTGGIASRIVRLLPDGSLQFLRR